MGRNDIEICDTFVSMNIFVKEWYKNHPICSCIFIRRHKSKCVIITVYVDDFNIVRTPEELQNIVYYLKKEFEMKKFRISKFCLGL